MEKPRLARLTAIITQLQAKSLVTARELAEKHGVSVRTIYRDITTLEQSGIPVYSEEGKGFRLLISYRLPPVSFTPEEAVALMTAQKLIERELDDSLARSLQTALDKVRSVMRATERDRLDRLEPKMYVRPRVGAGSNVLTKIQLAIGDYNLVEIKYLAADENISSRRVEPFALYRSTEENWVMIAYCRLRNDFRSFRLDRIQQFHPLGERFTPHPITFDDLIQQEYKKHFPTPDILLSSPSYNFGLSPKEQEMKNVMLSPFKVIGISIRTTNAEQLTNPTISQTWQRFTAGNLANKIPNRSSSEWYALYTDFESDQNGAYTFLLGCPVNNLVEIPDGMIGKSFPGGQFRHFVSEGNLMGGAVLKTWQEIWQLELDRNFHTDLEIYGEASMNPEKGKADVYVGVNK